jgi:uncharacterized protein (DUF488 family)
MSGLAPVGITVGAPRFELGYRLADNVRMLAPFGLLTIADEDEFTRRYRERLDRYSTDKILGVLAGIARREHTPGVVMLCYEPVGKFCHRRVLAQWIGEKNGQRVPELRH